MFKIIRRYVSDYSQTFRWLFGDISPNTAKRLSRIQRHFAEYLATSPRTVSTCILRCRRQFGDSFRQSPTPEPGHWSILVFSSNLVCAAGGCSSVAPNMDDNLTLILLHNLVTQIALTSALVLEQERNRRRVSGAVARNRRRRRIWVSQWLQRRLQQGAWQNLIPTLARTDQVLYRNTLRMEETMFDEILERVRPLITRQTTNFREPIEPGLRLAITLL